MTLEQAKERLKKVNEKNLKETRKQLRAAKRGEALKIINRYYLPEDMCAQFEEELKKKYKNNPKRLKSVIKQWWTTQKILSVVESIPQDYCKNSTKFFEYFETNAYSLDYVKKLKIVINWFVSMYCERLNINYKPL